MAERKIITIKESSLRYKVIRFGLLHREEMPTTQRGILDAYLTACCKVFFEVVYGILGVCILVIALAPAPAGEVGTAFRTVFVVIGGLFLIAGTNRFWWPKVKSTRKVREWLNRPVQYQ